MARIRSVKPEFWDSPDTIRASLRARLLYIAMWNWADDYGIGDGSLGRIINFAFPGDEIPAADFPTLASEVSEVFAVRFYTHRGRPYYFIPNWEKHQRTEKKARQVVPYPDDAEYASDQLIQSAADRPTLAADSPTLVADLPYPEQGEQGEQGEQARDRADAAPPLVLLQPDATFDDFWTSYPRRDDKTAARKAWTKATRTTSGNTIVAGAIRYAHDPNRKPEYTKMPATWLNAGSWENSALPAATQNESPAARATRLHAETLAALDNMEAINGNPAWSSRPALGARLA